MNDERRTDLPEWARYVAIDGDGSAWAFETLPELKIAKHVTYWPRPVGTRCVALASENGAFRLSDEAVARLVFPLAPRVVEGEVPTVSCIDCGYQPCECEVGYGPVTSAEKE